jgi:deoxyribodipyrimidine photo-lyase
MTAAPVLYWFRRDLRLADNPGLAAAIATGRPVLAVFILDETTAGAWAPGAASRWWLHHSLAALAGDLAARGAALVLRRGAYAAELPRLMADTQASEVHVGEPTEPWARRAIDVLGQTIPIHRHRTALLFHPDEIRTGSGTPYGVFTPYARACRALHVPHPPLVAPDRIPTITPPSSDTLENWALLPTAPDWAGGLRAGHVPGEAGAAQRLNAFLPRVAAYSDTRNLPGIAGTSMLSPHLAWGEISPGTIWAAASASSGKGLETFQNELLWREFSANLLWHFPALPDAPLKPAYAKFPWRDDPAGLRAWQTGQTGIPIVDAGMRQLWQTGWMHNRVRMIVASFLIKHLLIPWQLGEAWFWDCLVDADLAANAASWQWVAGSGADAAPFFRIFNPVLQGLKFDPAGDYVRRFVPELEKLPENHIHAPWEAPSPPRNYPTPVINLAFGRDRALAALQTITKSVE